MRRQEQQQAWRQGARRAALSGAVVATIAAMSASTAHAVVQDYNRARGGDGFQVTHPGNGFFQRDASFDGAPGAPGIAGDFFFSGSDGGFILDVRAPLGQGATWDQSANLATGDHGGYMYMDFFTTGTPGYPAPPQPWNVPGSFWFAGAGNEAGPLPAANPADPDLTQVLAYADVLAPAGKQFEFRIASPWTGQDNGIRFVGTGTGGWQTVGGALAGGGGTEMGSFDTLAPNLDMLVVFGSPAQGPMTWDSGGAFGSTPAVIRWDNLTLTAASAAWQGTGGGNWSSNANWSPAAPSGRNAVAVFGASANAQTVTLDSPVAAPDGDAPPRYSYYVGGVVFDSAAGSYTLAGSEPLIIDTTAANGVDMAGPNGSISVVSGSHTIAAPLRLNRTTNINVAAGQSLAVSGAQTAQAGAGIIKSGAGNLEMAHARGASLAVDGGVLKITDSNGAPSGVSNVGTLSIATGARLDLRDNKLVTNTPVGSFNGTAYTGVQGEVQRAYNFGAWDQPGLTTSEDNAGFNAGPLSGTTTIGVATAAQVLFIGETDTAMFQGQTVTGASTIAMYTYAGDLNFDGLVDGADYGVIDNYVQFPGTDGYVNGDFNYDGIIDGADYGVIDNTIQLQGAPFPGVVFGAGAAAISGVNAVPEPSACGFAIVTAAALLRRRRRRRAC